MISGTAKNATAAKFSLCNQVCVSVRSNGLPQAALLSDGRIAAVIGRVKEYRGNRYVDAESIELQ